MLSALDGNLSLHPGPLKGIREKWTVSRKLGTFRLQHSGGGWLIPGKTKQSPTLASKADKTTELGSWDMQDADTWDQRVLIVSTAASDQDSFLASNESLEMNSRLSTKATWKFVSAADAPDYPDGYGDGYGNMNGLDNGVRGVDGFESGIYAILDEYGRYLGSVGGALQTAALMMPDRNCFKWYLNVVAPCGKVISCNSSFSNG